MARDGACGLNKEIAKEALQDTLVMRVSFHLYEYLALFDFARDQNSECHWTQTSSNGLEDIEIESAAQEDPKDNWKSS
jgi:hypothetical protein